MTLGFERGGIMVGPKVFLAAASIALSQAPASGQITKQGDRWQMRVRYTPGATTRYQMDSVTPGAGQGGGSMRVPVEVKVKSVRGAMATLRVTVGPVALNGRQVAPARVSEFKAGPRGEMSGAVGPGIESVAGMVFPAKPLRVGETFTDPASKPVPGQTIVAKKSYTFRGVRSEGGRQVAVFEERVTGSGTSALGGQAVRTAVRGTGTKRFDAADGQLLSAESKQAITLTQGGQSQTMANTVTVRRR
jgi:hypothetical protein